MNRMVKSRDYLRKCLGFVLLFGFISLGTIAGCDNDNNGSGKNLAILLGEHRQDASDHIHAAFNVSDTFEGKLNNIILDGTNLDNLTQDDIDIIRDAYLQGFMIIVYDITEAQIAELHNIIDHPTKYDSNEVLSLLDQGDEGDHHEVFIIERFGRVNSSSTLQLGNLKAAELPDGSIDPATGLADEDIRFRFHALHIKELIEEQEERLAQLVEDGLVDTSAEEILRRYGLMDEFKAQLASVATQQSTQTGDLINIASADIHTGYVRTGFLNNGTIGVGVSSADEVNTYQFTNKVWTLTADTPNGIFSFIFVDQSMNLASSNGFLKNDEGSTAFSNAQQYWYLSDLIVVNTLQAGSTTLGLSDLTLLDDQPSTNQATTVSVTTSVEANVSGTVGVDQDGANASVSGGVSWGSSETYDKANVSINNKSLSETTEGSDASWQYVPNAASPGGSKGTCNNLGLRGLADLAHETFTPDQAFIYRIDPSFRGETLKIKTVVTIQMRNTYSSGCNIFGCSCGKTDQNSAANGPFTFTHSITIPEAPEGPAGDPTCTDGVDNDRDGGADSSDDQC